MRARQICAQAALTFPQAQQKRGVYVYNVKHNTTNDTQSASLNYTELLRLNTFYYLFVFSI